MLNRFNHGMSVPLCKCSCRLVFKWVPWQRERKLVRRLRKMMNKLNRHLMDRETKKDGLRTSRLTGLIESGATNGVWQAKAVLWHPTPSDIRWQLLCLMDSGLSQWVEVTMVNWHQDSCWRGLEILTCLDTWTIMTPGSFDCIAVGAAVLSDACCSNYDRRYCEWNPITHIISGFIDSFDLKHS